MVEKAPFRATDDRFAAPADGTRRSTVGTLNMGACGLGVVKPWPGTLTVMSPLPLLAMVATVGHMGSHTVDRVRIHTLLNVHVHTTHVQRAFRVLLLGWMTISS